MLSRLLLLGHVKPLKSQGFKDVAFYWSPDKKCGKGVLCESLCIQLLTHWQVRHPSCASHILQESRSCWILLSGCLGCVPAMGVWWLLEWIPSPAITAAPWQGEMLPHLNPPG